MVYNGIEDISLPTWVEKLPPKTGLDLLGLRNPVLSIGNIYLSGITTITPTIRYLSIRAWIIWKYAQLALPDSLKVMREFSSKIESAIVFGNLLNKRDTFGLIGRNEGVHIIERDVDPLPLERLVKGPIALDIYTGPSLQLGIGQEVDSEVYGLSKERGLPLALEIDRQIKNTKFYQYVDDIVNIDAIKKDILHELGSVLHVENMPDSEVQLLLEAVIPNKPINQTEIYRVATYSLLLQLSANKKSIPKPSDVFMTSIDPAPNLPEVFQAVLDGWLLFTVRDMLAIVHESILKWVVDLLPTDKRKYKTTASDVIGELLSNESEINHTLKELGILKMNESFQDLRYRDILSRCRRKIQKPIVTNGIRRWNGSFHELDLYSFAWYQSPGIIGLLPVAWIMASFRVAENNEETESPASLLSFKEGRMRLGLEQVILPTLKQYEKKNTQLPEILSEMIRFTIDQHLRIAWSRMASNSENVALLYTEGENWIPVDERDFQGGQMASRLDEAIGWLQQLGFIDDKGITEKGKDILERGYTTISTNG